PTQLADLRPEGASLLVVEPTTVRIPHVGQRPAEHITRERAAGPGEALLEREGDHTLGAAVDVDRVVLVAHKTRGAVGLEEAPPVELEAGPMGGDELVRPGETARLRYRIQDESGVVVVMGDTAVRGRIGVVPGTFVGLLGDDVADQPAAL